MVLADPQEVSTHRLKVADLTGMHLTQFNFSWQKSTPQVEGIFLNLM